MSTRQAGSVRYGNVILALEEKVPPVKVPPALKVLAAPDAPMGTPMLTVITDDVDGAMLPTAMGRPGAVAVPTLRLVTVTLFAVAPPEFVSVSCTTTLFDPSRLSTRVTPMLGPAGCCTGSTLMVVPT